MPRKNGANGLLGPNGLAPLPPPPLPPPPLPSSSSSSSSPGSLLDTGTLLTTAIFTTAGPYFCTIVLKSGNTAAGLPVAGTVVAGPVVVLTGAGVVAAAPVPPKAYKVPIGAAMMAAPTAAATSGFFTKV